MRLIGPIELNETLCQNTPKSIKRETVQSKRWLKNKKMNFKEFLASMTALFALMFVAPTHAADMGEEGGDYQGGEGGE